MILHTQVYTRISFEGSAYMLPQSNISAVFGQCVRSVDVEVMGCRGVSRRSRRV
jgi:hypothetical protein